MCVFCEFRKKFGRPDNSRAEGQKGGKERKGKVMDKTKEVGQEKGHEAVEKSNQTIN